MKKASWKKRNGKVFRIASRSVAIMVASMLLLSSEFAVACTLSHMTMEYDWDNQILSVIAPHSVSNPNSHNIWNITV